MSADRHGSPGSLSPVEAGQVLGLPADVVRALADAGYLRPSTVQGGVPRFALGDLKSFEARESSVSVPGITEADLDGSVLLALVGARVPAIAARGLDIVGAVLPEVRELADDDRDAFLADTQARLEAILAVCVGGPDVALEDDLAAAGAEAARGGVPLPAVLLTLRTSRDLVVQAAIEATEDLGVRWALALSVALTRVLQAIDRLTDAVTDGYCSADS